jgi:hypothetical protein
MALAPSEIAASVPTSEPISSRASPPPNSKNFR